MIVACPSCQTRFQLDSAKLQPVGRHVRCAKCAHRWLQLPEGVEPPGSLLLSEPAEPAPEPTPPAESPPSAQTGAIEVVQAEPAAAEEPPAEAAETPAAMAESLAAIAQQVNAATQAPTVEKTGPAGPASPVQRLGMRMTGPIIVPPQMKPARRARRSSGLGSLLVIGLIIGIVLGLAYFFRDTIARTIPGAEAVYALLGLSTDNPADDLEISIEKVDAQDDGGKRFFSVTATVFNLSEYPVDVPPLVIVPVDEAGNQMEPIRFRLKERVAQPGQNIKFQKSFDNWPITAKSFVLSVAEAP